MPDQARKSAIERWSETVRAEHAQADRVRSDAPGSDQWKALAHRFTPASREKAREDDTLKAVLPYVRPDDTVLDVGAGAGRLAVPLAERCKHVTAVEPSEVMQDSMRDQAAEWGIDNLEIIGSTWQEAKAGPADVVICAHVVYTVEDIDRFIEKLSAGSRRDVIVIVFEEPAMANYFPLWESVYGEKRISLPSLAELKGVLAEMQISFNAQPLPEWESRPFPDAGSAFNESLARLFISPDNHDSPHTQKLRTVLEKSLVPSGGGLRFRWAKSHRPWLVHWTV